jgi:aminoglycoside phosphotransferase (APT) family kinase protein
MWQVSAMLGEMGVISALQRSVRVRFGRDHVVSGVALAGGHAGLTFRFDYGPPGGVAQHAIIKLAPPGVRRSVVNDFGAQAALLRALAGRQVPVPEVLWEDPTGEEMGTPCLVMRRMPGGERFPLGTPGEAAGDAALDTVWSLAVDALATLDSVPVSGLPIPLTDGRSLAEEIAHWEPTLRKAPVAGWIEAGLRAREALEATRPPADERALNHGDFQPANLLVADGAVSAIIDWDLAGIGARGLDLGWLMMWCDPACWGPHWRVRSPLRPVEVVARFEAATGRPAPAARWFEALAAYRFGAITCLNVHLHRSGKRVDEVWELFALDVERLFERSGSMAREATWGGVL